ncbi:polysaccharide pyruvyl transferase family protein [Salibacterium sp. K-3]
MTKLPEGFDSFQEGLETSRKKLRRQLETAEDLTFVNPGGNLGDHLIWAGLRRLLSGIPYREIPRSSIDKAEGETAVVAGPGGWCRAHHAMPELLPMIEERFEHVILIPSSFDITLPAVKKALARTKALVFARELLSYKKIKDLCRSDLAYDCAFFYDYSSHLKKGKGTLTAYRTDRERIKNEEFKSRKNRDISRTAGDLDSFLRVIADHDTVYTDRAHVMIAGAMLKKTVYYQPSNYHKLPGIADFTLRGFPVYPLEKKK